MSLPSINDKFDRITTCLDYFTEPELVAWKVRVGQKEAGRISRAALKIGSRVDELIKTQKPAIKKDSLEVYNCLVAFNRWVKDYNIDIDRLKFPKRFYDEAEMLTGEADCIYGDTLIDFKCSARISKKYWLQVCKYSQYFPQIKKVAILRLSKNLGDYEYKTNETIGLELADGISFFNCILNAYRFLKQDKCIEENANGTDTDYSTNESDVAFQKVGNK